MSELTLTKTKFQSGVWQGVLSGATEQPEISVTHLNAEISGVTLTVGTEANTWLLKIPVPPEAISEGMQTLLITDKSSDRLLEKISLIAGEALGDDLRAEVDLLRAELDMLKRAFRRHCLETSER